MTWRSLCTTNNIPEQHERTLLAQFERRLATTMASAAGDRLEKLEGMLAMASKEAVNARSKVSYDHTRACAHTQS
jgi:hypothetical protein